jgi:hypothetical protein
MIIIHTELETSVSIDNVKFILPVNSKTTIDNGVVKISKAEGNTSVDKEVYKEAKAEVRHQYHPLINDDPTRFTYSNNVDNQLDSDNIEHIGAIDCESYCDNGYETRHQQYDNLDIDIQPKKSVSFDKRLTREPNPRDTNLLFAKDENDDSLVPTITPTIPCRMTKITKSDVENLVKKREEDLGYSVEPKTEAISGSIENKPNQEVKTKIIIHDKESDIQVKLSDFDIKNKCVKDSNGPCLVLFTNDEGFAQSGARLSQFQVNHVQNELPAMFYSIRSRFLKDLSYKERVEKSYQFRHFQMSKTSRVLVREQLGIKDLDKPDYVGLMVYFKEGKDPNPVLSCIDDLTKLNEYETNIKDFFKTFGLYSSFRTNN